MEAMFSPTCLFLSAQFLYVQLCKQPRGWHCCKLFHGPNSGTKNCSHVQCQTLTCDALFSPLRAWRTSGLNLVDVGPSPVLWLPWNMSLCTSLRAHVYFLGLGAHLGPTLAEIITSAKYLPEGLVWKNLLWFGLYFRRVINLGKSCFYLFSASKILCQ